MAKDETKLLQTLTDRTGKLPARRDERELEPTEVEEPSRGTEEGRSPEEVLGEHETRPGSVDGKSKLPKKWKVRIDDGSGEPVIKELTLQEMQEQGLLDKLITTSNQFPTVQKKYTELLEQTAESKKPAKKVEDTAAAKPVAPTAEQILNAYTPIIKELTEKGYYEPDFAEAYPKEASLIAYLWDQNIDLAKKLSGAIQWILGEIKERNKTKVDSTLDAAIEAVAAKGDGEKGDPLYKELRDPEVHADFVKWIKEEIDPRTELLTAKNVEKFWFAFKAPEILDVTREMAKRATEPPPKRRAAGDGSPSRPSGHETPKEKSLLDRMTESRLEAQA